MKVFIVIHCDYGDQGVDVHEVCKTYQLAQQFIEKHELNERERQWWDILEQELQE